MKLCEHYQNRGAQILPRLTKKFSSQKSSLPFGAARLHLKSSSFSAFSREMMFAPKSSWEFISDLFFYAVLTVVVVMTLFQLRSCSVPTPTSSANYDEIASLISKQFHSELRRNPEFAKVIKGAL